MFASHRYVCASGAPSALALLALDRQVRVVRGHDQGRTAPHMTNSPFGQQLRRRRFLTLGLGAAGVSLLAACAQGAPAAKPAATGGAPATGATSAPAAGSTQGSIRIALFGSRESADRRAALIPGFTKLYPNVKVEYTPIQGSDWEEFFSKVLTMKAANNAPDITFVATEGTQLFAGQGLALPLDDYIKRDQKDSTGQTQVFGYQWVNRLWGSWMPWIFVNGSNLLTEERAPGGEWLWQTFYKGDAAANGRGGGWRWNAPKANDPANIEALEFMVQLLKEGVSAR